MIATSTPIDAKALIIRALGRGVSVRFTETKSGFWWCEIRLPPFGFERATVCCPGLNQMAAAVNAIAQADRLRKAAA